MHTYLTWAKNNSCIIVLCTVSQYYFVPSSLNFLEIYSMDIPNPFGNAVEFGGLVRLWNSCVNVHIFWWNFPVEHLFLWHWKFFVIVLLSTLFLEIVIHVINGYVYEQTVNLYLTFFFWIKSLALTSLGKAFYTITEDF